jgi:hypothetical protein
VINFLIIKINNIVIQDELNTGDKLMSFWVMVLIVSIPIIASLLWLVSGVVKKNKRVIVGASLMLFVFLMNVFFLYSPLINNTPFDKVVK